MSRKIKAPIEIKTPNVFIAKGKVMHAPIKDETKLETITTDSILYQTIRKAFKKMINSIKSTTPNPIPRVHTPASTGAFPAIIPQYMGMLAMAGLSRNKTVRITNPKYFKGVFLLNNVFSSLVLKFKFFVSWFDYNKIKS